MPHHTARIGRRRRVLNEEVLTASAMGIAARSRDDLSRTPRDTPRYGVGADIENHPQITDYVPRRYYVIALGMMAGLALGACGELIANHATTLSKLVGTVSPNEITATLADGLVAWTSATAFVVWTGTFRLNDPPLMTLHRLRSRAVWAMMTSIALANPVGTTPPPVPA